MSLSVGFYQIPHPKKAGTGGEDSFFVSSCGGVIAIADGVSGWAEKDINPALFSQQLMSYTSMFVSDVEVNYDPQLLLKKAHAAMETTGSATVIIAMFEKNGLLKIANVGDCGLRVIRKGQVVFATCQQEHYFNCPYQISSEAVGQTWEDAVVCSVNLLENDLIVMGSDGLFDNLFDLEISPLISGVEDMPAAAKALAELARTHSADASYDSPFSIEARNKGFGVPWWRRAVGGKLIGGKMDDITVIVARVLKSPVLNDELGLLKDEVSAGDS